MGHGRLAFFLLLYWFINSSLTPNDLQNKFVLKRKYQAVNYDASSVKNAENLFHFYFSLNELMKGKKKKVKIVQIGDSHIQADFLSHTTRKLMQRTFGNGGRGFIFPYRLARSNSPLNLNIKHNGLWEACQSVRLSQDCNFGVSGASATTHDSTAWLKIDPHRDGDMNYEFDQMTLYGFNGETTFNPIFLDADSVPLECDILPIGKSVSKVYFTDIQDSFWLAFEKSQEQDYYQLFGMSLENDNPGIVYHSIGLNGAYAKSYLRNQFFVDQLSDLGGDLIILSLGTNDAYMPSSRFCSTCFKENYTRLIDRIKEANPSASLLFTTPGDFYVRRRYHNSNIQAVVKAIYEIAEKYEAGVWDFNQIMGGDYSMRKWLKEGLGRGDLIHFTKEGYELQGQLLYFALLEAYEKEFDD
jgi:lysophospholipase L1-like esterase